MKQKQYLRAFCERAAGGEGQAGDPIRFVASTEGVKRDGLDLDATKWNLENFQKNPVFLWCHDYYGRNLPLGRVDVTAEAKRLLADVLFDQADPFARDVERKYRTGFLHAVSVGWDEVVRCGQCQGLLDRYSTYGLDYYRRKCPHCEAELTPETVQIQYDLLDLSGVPVPGDPDALIEREYRALKDMVERGGAEDRGEASWEELAAEMAGLFRPDADDTDGERETRYKTLLPRYRRLGKEPPEFRTIEDLVGLGAEEVRGLFLEGEEIYIPMEEKRAGAVLSNRNQGDLQQAVSLIQGVLERAKKEEGSEETQMESVDETDIHVFSFLNQLENLK